MNKKSRNKQMNRAILASKPIETEWGIINPLRKEPQNNDRCGINREKNPCGDASEY